jgi:hypothetical protein
MRYWTQFIRELTLLSVQCSSLAEGVALARANEDDLLQGLPNSGTAYEELLAEVQEMHRNVLQLRDRTVLLVLQAGADADELREEAGLTAERLRQIIARRPTR